MVYQKDVPMAVVMAYWLGEKMVGMMVEVRVAARVDARVEQSVVDLAY